MKSTISPNAEVEFLAGHLRHVSAVRRHLQRIRHELERRELVHDDSKLTPDQLPGFVRLAATAGNVYGTDGYRQAIEAERPTVERHQRAEDHHPERHCATAIDGEVGRAPQMGWLDVVEMVCDWRGAWETRRGALTWEQSVGAQIQRFEWAEGQRWLIRQVAQWIADGAGAR